MPVLIPLLGDQLSFDISSLESADLSETIILMMEVAEEATYVRHHKAKLAYIFSAMRHHALALSNAGWTVDYVRLDDIANEGSFTGEVAKAITRHRPDRIVVTEAGEWRVAAMLESWQALFGIPVDIRPDARFFFSRSAFAAWADGRAELVMEDFYRKLRLDTGLLIDDGEPAGGRWNFDKDNRRRAMADLLMPRRISFTPDAITCAVLVMVEERFADNPGCIDRFDYAVTAADAARQAEAFFAHALRDFGPYEDAMLTGEPQLWHSILSPCINVGLLDPRTLCACAEAEYRAGRVPLNSAEGYIRQILGWREYVRGIYWREGPDYARRNFLEHDRPLPAFYYSGATDQHCLAQVIGQTLATGHAHHIQRLMVTGNFALLIGVDPAAVHIWYLEIYVDAFEWVELPNTLGMSQYGDGGLLGSKPYAASGAYINRMSDYCRHCRYDVTKRTGDDACPFNALYWDFLARHRAKLGDNARLQMPYRNWDRIAPQEQRAIRAQAAKFLAKLDAAD